MMMMMMMIIIIIIIIIIMETFSQKNLGGRRHLAGAEVGKIAAGKWTTWV
jgi:ABC-type cobalt transport system substrate-binding protein